MQLWEELRSDVQDPGLVDTSRHLDLRRQR